MKVSILAGASALVLAASSAQAAVVFTTNTPGFSSFVIQTTGLYEVSAWGASGGNDGYDGSQGGAGFGLSDTVQFTAGTRVIAYVGQAGSSSYPQTGGGGGGGAGTYVSSTSTALLIAAGGGGASYGQAGQDGQGVVSGDPAQVGDGGEAEGSGGSGGSGGGGGSNGHATGRDGRANFRSGGGLGGSSFTGGAGGTGTGGAQAGKGGDGIFAGGGGGGSAATGGAGGYGGGGGGYSGGDGYGFGGTSMDFYSDTPVTLATNRGNGVVTISFLASAVPEPSNWTMLLAGFGIVGYAMRRRRVRFA